MPRKLILVLGLFTLLGLSASLSTRLVSAAEPSTPGASATHETHAPAASGPDAHEETPNILKFELDLAFWTFVVFLLLLFVLGKTAWKPLIKAMHDREEHIEHCLLSAEKARNESEQLLAQHRTLMAEAADQVRALLDEARRDGQAAQEEILAKARAEADAEKDRARRDIETARDQALSEIWTKAADLAVSVAGRVLGKEMNEGDHRRLIEAATRALPAAPTTNGQGSHSV